MNKNLTDKNSPLVSICIMIYNQESYIEKCIQSAINQTYQNIEIIISNNGSTDNSQKVIQNFLKYGNIQSLDYQDNNKIGVTSNNAFKKAKGKYICFIAGDDYYLPEYVEKNLNTIVKLPDDYGLVYSPTYVYNELTDTTYIEDKVFNKSGYVFNEIIESQVTGMVPAFTPFFKKEVFNIVSYDETVFCEGEMIFIRIAEYYKFQYINLPLMVSTDHLNNQGKNYKENAQSFYDESIKLIAQFPDKTQIINQIIGRMYLRNSWIALRLMSDRRWMLSCLKVMFKHYPLLAFHWKFYRLVMFFPFSSRVINSILFFKNSINSRNATHIEKNYKNSAK